MLSSGERRPAMACAGRVLLVDDEAPVRRPIAISLRQAGFDVLEAEDGRQAAEMLNAGDNPLRVDLILCDIRMPNVNGADAIAYFRREYPSVPIVVLTGYPDVELAVSLLKMGVTDYVLKPIGKQDLLAVVKRAVESRTLFKDHFVV